MKCKHKEVHHVNHETGEVLKSTQTFKAASEPEFVKMYVSDIANLYQLCPGAERVLLCLATMVDYKSRVIVPKYIKQEIANLTKLKLAVVANKLSELVKVGAIAKLGGGAYMLNPMYFAKGQWHEISKHRNAFIEMKITYKGNKRTVKSGVITETTEGESQSYVVTEDGERIEL